MENLTPSVSFDKFIDNYLTFFRLITHLGINNIRATCVLNKNMLRKITGDKLLRKKRSVSTLNSAHQAKKQRNRDSGWLERQHCNLHSFFWILRTQEIYSVLEQSWKIYIQDQQPNQFHCYNQNMSFVNRVDQNVVNYWYPNEKMVVVPICWNGRCCHSGCGGIVSH